MNLKRRAIPAALLLAGAVALAVAVFAGPGFRSSFSAGLVLGLCAGVLAESVRRPL
jgi:hypothetical protein